MYTLKCTMYTKRVHCVMYSVHFTMYSEQFTYYTCKYFSTSIRRTNSVLVYLCILYNVIEIDVHYITYIHKYQICLK